MKNYLLINWNDIIKYWFNAYFLEKHSELVNYVSSADVLYLSESVNTAPLVKDSVKFLVSYLKQVGMEHPDTSIYIVESCSPRNNIKFTSALDFLHRKCSTGNISKLDVMCNTKFLITNNDVLFPVVKFNHLLDEIFEVMKKKWKVCGKEFIFIHSGHLDFDSVYNLAEGYFPKKRLGKWDPPNTKGITLVSTNKVIGGLVDKLPVDSKYLKSPSVDQLMKKDEFANQVKFYIERKFSLGL